MTNAQIAATQRVQQQARLLAGMLEALEIAYTDNAGNIDPRAGAVIDAIAAPLESLEDALIGLEATTPIAEGEGFAFYQLGEDVYRAPINADMDTYGLPMGRRWECSLEHWDRFRNLFAWAV